MYVTCQPCNNCAKMIINAGIVRVIYEGDYPDDFSKELFKDSGIEVMRFIDNRPFGLLHAKAVGNVRRDRLDLNT